MTNYCVIDCSSPHNDVKEPYIHGHPTMQHVLIYLIGTLFGFDNCSYSPPPHSNHHGMGSETVASDNRIKENILSATVELDWLYSQIVTYHSEHCILLLDYLDFENVLPRHFHLILDPLIVYEVGSANGSLFVTFCTVPYLLCAQGKMNPVFLCKLLQKLWCSFIFLFERLGVESS